MKIEKKKITGDKQLSAAAKSAIAATLGMAAAFTLNACDDTVSGGSEEPLGGDMPPEDVIPPASSDSPDTGTSSSEATPNSSSQTEGPASSSQVENTPSSSSEKIVDIPLSQEPVSSSVEEAISSLMESSSSVAAPASSAVAPESSSDVVPPVSSEAAPTSSETATSSSSYAQWGPGNSSSSQNGWVKPNSSSVDYSEECPDNDPYCINYYFCRDNPSGCMAGSMVTTFERDDVTG